MCIRDSYRHYLFLLSGRICGRDHPGFLIAGTCQFHLTLPVPLPLAHREAAGHSKLKNMLKYLKGPWLADCEAICYGLFSSLINAVVIC